MNPILCVVSFKNALIFWFYCYLQEKGHLFNWSGKKNHHAVSVSNPQILKYILLLNFPDHWMFLLAQMNFSSIYVELWQKLKSGHIYEVVKMVQSNNKPWELSKYVVKFQPRQVYKPSHNLLFKAKMFYCNSQFYYKSRRIEWGARISHCLYENRMTTPLIFL